MQIAQRTNAPAVARPLDGLRLGVHRLGCSSGPARPLRPQPSDKLEFSQHSAGQGRSASCLNLVTNVTPGIAVTTTAANRNTNA
jgi:hypothetical protein